MDDEGWMKEALRMAKAAARRGEVPVGAAIIRGEKLLARASNRVEGLRDATQHAEIRLIRRASRRLGNWRLVGCTVYVTKEPCPMCAGALALSRVDRIVFGAPDPEAGGCGSKYSIVTDGSQRHRVQVTGGVLDIDCARLLRECFQARRVHRP